MKGSSPAGNTTSTQINPTQQMQAPFLQGGWNSALNLMNNFPKSYYPNTTLANYLPPDPLLTSGYQNTYNAGQNLQNNYLPGFQQNYQSMAGYAPQIAGYGASAAQNNNPALNSLMSTAQGGGPGMAELAKAASGYYVGSNPYLSGAIQAAQDPVTRNYQTATAPTIDAALSSSGRYGSGAQAGLYDTSQQNLGKALGDISTNMSNLNYGRERQLQDDAARGYVSGANTAGAAGGGLYNQGLQLGIQGGGTASDAARQYAALWPTLSSAMMAAPQAELQAGQGLTNIEQLGRQYEQQQIDDQKARFYGNQQAPYDTLSAYLNNIGQPTTGTSQTTQPYFQNQLSSLLGAGLGLTGIGKNLGLFGSGGLGGLGGTAASGLSTGLTGAESAAGFDTLGSTVGMGAADVGGGAAASSFLPALAWIICTELMRQKKMPFLYWMTGSTAFANYPDIIKRGYYVWAVPSVRHLRRRPNSLYSRLLGKVFGWRAEDLAARAGVAGARKLWRGRAVTAALCLPCLALGVLVPEQDWQSVYREKAT